MKTGRGSLAKLISVLSAILLVICLLMMIKVFYFPKKGVHHGPPAIDFEEETTGQLPEIEKLKPVGVEVFDKILKEKAFSQMEHFHNVDDSLDIKKRVPSLCLICHGSYPHIKDKEVRSLYNMHTFFCQSFGDSPPDAGSSFRDRCDFVLQIQFHNRLPKMT